MRQFFFDTANVDYISDFWEKTGDKIDKKLVAGVTTNPNAFYKIDKNRLSDWFEETKKLCELVSDIRQDGEGVVYIQCPNSNMEPSDVIEYAKRIKDLSDGKTKVGLKIPPYKRILEVSNELSNYVDVNVTGISDAATALKSLSYGVRYVSIIPGRMEEVGIYAKGNVSAVNQAFNVEGRIITGSMRTIDQVVWTFQYKTVPTIGERVLDLMLEPSNMDQVLNIDYNVEEEYTSPFCPMIDEKNHFLSTSFFKQMDSLGENAYNDWRSE